MTDAFAEFCRLYPDRQTPRADGAAMFACTVNGKDRWEVPGGNIVCGSGISSAYALLGDLAAAAGRFRWIRDDEGQPWWAWDVTKHGLLVVHPLLHNFKDVSIPGVTFHPWAEIHDNDWYVILKAWFEPVPFEQACVRIAN